VTPALSIVIPLYRSEEGLPALFEALSRLSVSEGLEVVFVNDGSPDRTGERCRELLRTAPFPGRLVDLMRNFGEHNAVMAGYRHARGAWIVNIDDDLQNPPEEAIRLFRYARDHGFDAVYTHYREKQHDRWRNLGSRLANAVADFLLDKPKGLYLSSFRCVTATVAQAITRYEGPYPYIDGLVSQVTQKIGSIPVRHEKRQFGTSNYNLRRLTRLWTNIVFNFSVMPLRLALLLGFATAALGFVLIIAAAIEVLVTHTPPGWGSLLAAIVLFSGVQLIVLGGIGEYVGRTFLTINRRPQSAVREVIEHLPASGARGAASG
jgi:undecaprenyl-phosphate 4-deoxy-4-formamido-L-arabinose transferase